MYFTANVLSVQKFLLWSLQSETCFAYIVLQGSGKNKKEKTGLSLVDLGYRRAKAVKAVKKAMDSGKIVQKKASKKSKQPPERTQSRTEEMQELFQSDMNERKQKRSSGTGNRKSKSSFKSKSRYKSA